MAFAVAASAVLLVSVVIAFRLRVPARPVPAEVTVFLSMKWEAPTDFLLDTPGSALRSTVPAFSPVPDYAPLTTTKENR